MPGMPTPAWTRLVIETAGGELWVAACNFYPELDSLEKLPDGTIPVLTYEGHEYIQLEKAAAVCAEARLVCDCIKQSLSDANCVWRRRPPAEGV